MYPHRLQKRKGKGSCPLVSKLRHNTMQMQPRTHCFCNYATAVNLYLYSNLILHLHSIIRSVTEHYTQYVTHSHSVFYTQTEPKCPICFRNHAWLLMHSLPIILSVPFTLPQLDKFVLKDTEAFVFVSAQLHSAIIPLAPSTLFRLAIFV